MLADWDDPFGDYHAYNPLTRSQIQAFKTAAGPVVPESGVDLERIHRSQERLCAYFETIFYEASEALDAADPLSRKLSEREVLTSVLYRIPDRPAFLNVLHHQTTAHVVTLVDTGEKSHPLVESLFPVRAFPELSEQEQNALRSVVQIRLAQRSLDEDRVPQHIRIVFPEVAKYVMDWLQKMDGTINKFRYNPLRPAHENEDFVHAFHIN